MSVQFVGEIGKKLESFFDWTHKASPIYANVRLITSICSVSSQSSQGIIADAIDVGIFPWRDYLVTNLNFCSKKTKCPENSILMLNDFHFYLKRNSVGEQT